MESIWKYGLLHFALLFSFIYSFGVVYGLFALAAFILLADYVLDKLGYVRITFGDLLMCHEKPGCNHNIAGLIEIEKGTYQEFAQAFRDKAIKNTRKLSQIRTSYLGVYLWKDISQDTALQQVMKWNRSIHNIEQGLQFMSEIVNQKMPDDKPLWEYHFIEDYTKESSLIVTRMSHCYTDAMGYMSLLSCLNDEEYRIKLEKEIPKQSILQIILLWLATIPLTIRFIYATKNSHTDENAAKIREFDGENEHKIKFYMSKSFDFEKVKKCYKRYEKTTFNDYAWGIISASLDKWYKTNGIEGANSIKTLIPINTKPFPKGFEDLNIDNRTVCFKHVLPIGSNMVETMDKSKKLLKKYLKPHYFLANLNFGKLLQFLPSWFIRNLILEDFYNGIDMVFSNVPLSSKPIYFLNKKILNMGAYSNLQYDIKLMVVAVTYQNDLKFELTANTKLKMNPDKLLEIIEETLAKDIKENSKSE